MTTVFVTHDQEEAMQIADQIVLVNKGRIEQVGTGRDLYERPANEFVLTFVGEATLFGGELVRPHDVVLSTLPRTAPRRRWSSGSRISASRCACSSCSATAERFDAQLTRDEAERLELAQGQIVYARLAGGSVPGGESQRGRGRTRANSSRGAAGGSPDATSASVTGPPRTRAGGSRAPRECSAAR